MDPRQMVALRKALEASPEGAESPEQMQAETVQCPECGAEFVPEPVAEAPVEEPPVA